MTTILRTVLVSSIIILSSCKPKAKQTAAPAIGAQEKSQPSRAEVLVAQTIKAHGGELYDLAHYGFIFRDKSYTFKNSTNSTRYTVKSIKNTDTILDILENDKLTRTINGKPVALSEKDLAKYTEALNSVVYFVTLPHKLKDRAVNKTYEGRTTIKDQGYALLRVSFDKEGGGKDYDDKFMYWINTNTKTVDYLAYSYSTNDGGVRFRSAFNPRMVGGIRFQDYINYEAPVGTPLKDLPALYEEEDLRELSQIITEDVRLLQ